jgi:hypothetical protein
MRALNAIVAMGLLGSGYGAGLLSAAPEPEEWGERPKPPTPTYWSRKMPNDPADIERCSLT